MARLSLSPNGSSAFERLLGHNPAVLDAWRALEAAFAASPTFSPELREQVRRALAFGNECQYCMARAGPPDPRQDDRRDGLLIAVADLIGRDHRQVLPEHVDMLSSELGPAAAAELLALCAFLSGSQIFGALAGLTADDLAVRQAANP